jgi:hypothetical protein
MRSLETFTETGVGRIKEVAAFFNPAAGLQQSAHADCSAQLPGRRLLSPRWKKRGAQASLGVGRLGLSQRLTAQT